MNWRKRKSPSASESYTLALDNVCVVVHKSVLLEKEIKNQNGKIITPHAIEGKEKKNSKNVWTKQVSKNQLVKTDSLHMNSFTRCNKFDEHNESGVFDGGWVKVCTEIYCCYYGFAKTKV